MMLTQPKILGEVTMELSFTFRHVLRVKGFLYTTKMNKNLMPCFLFNKASFKQVIESDQYMITKNGIFVGQCYACDRILKLKVEMNNMTSTSI